MKIEKIDYLARLIAGACAAGSALFQVWPVAGSPFVMPGFTKDTLLKFWLPLAGGIMLLFPSLKLPQQAYLGPLAVGISAGYQAYELGTSNLTARTLLSSWVPAAAALKLLI